MNGNGNERANLSRMDSEIWSKMHLRISNDYDRYGKVRHVTWPKRLLMPFSSRVRANVRLEKYANLFKDVKRYMEKAAEYERKLQDPTISESKREDYEDYRSMYIDKVQDKSEKMAKTAVKYMKSAGYYSRLRTRRFIDSVNRLKSKSRSKKAKLEKNPFIRIYTLLRGDYRKFEKSVRSEDRDYLERAVENLSGLNSHNQLLENKGLLSNLEPKRGGVVMTVASQPPFPTPEIVANSPIPAPAPRDTQTAGNAAQSQPADSDDVLQRYAGRKAQYEDMQRQLDAYRTQYGPLNPASQPTQNLHPGRSI